MTETGQSDEAAGMSRDLWPFPPHSAPQRPEGPETPHGSCPVETKDAKKSSQGKYFWHSAPVAASGWVWGCGPSLYTSVLIPFPSLLQ